MPNKELLENICRLLRYDILTATAAAGSGHPTSSLSAVELMAVLFFSDFLHFDIENPKNITNDRFILSKGHASPLLYSLYHAAGAINYEELLTLRQFGSRLEGHPTPSFPFVDIATGSLGQGLSAGVGMAIAVKLLVNRYRGSLGQTLKVSRQDDTSSETEKQTTIPKVWVLMGDSECDEGQVWEAIESAARFKLDNLVGVLDTNKIGQYGETDEGWNLEKYVKKFQAFGWNTILVKDGHDLEQVFEAYKKVIRYELLVQSENKKPSIIIAKTIKGKGISFLENKQDWHGKTLTKDQLGVALKELGSVDLKARGKINKANFQFLISNIQSNPNDKISKVISKLEEFIPNQKPFGEISTREAYGDELVELGMKDAKVVVLDAGVANSTFENKFQKRFPDRFFEMSIAEENMAGVAVGLSKLGFIPFFSTFAAFLTQTFDQLRMAQYSATNLKIVGSHAGVSIGQDGPSQMGLEDLAMMRSILNSVVFYPADGTSTKKITQIMFENQGIFYLRTTRGKTPIIYQTDEEFKIAGCKVHKVAKSLKSIKSKVLIIAAGITLHEALQAQKELIKDNIEAIVIDCYSIKPLDEKTISNLISEYKNVMVVEDHYPCGGLGEAVSSLVTNHELQITNFSHLCVRKLPKSGKPEELLGFEEIDSEAIVKQAKDLVR